MDVCWYHDKSLVHTHTRIVTVTFGFTLLFWSPCLVRCVMHADARECPQLDPLGISTRCCHRGCTSAELVRVIADRVYELLSSWMTNPVRPITRGCWRSWSWFYHSRPHTPTPCSQGQEDGLTTVTPSTEGGLWIVELTLTLLLSLPVTADAGPERVKSLKRHTDPSYNCNSWDTVGWLDHGLCVCAYTDTKFERNN